MTAVIDELKTSGFVNAGPIALTAEESRELARLTTEVYAAMPSDHPHFLGAQSGGEGFRGLPEHHPRLAALIDRVVSDDRVRAVLTAALGPSYKIWQIDFRRSKAGDGGLYLHQDAPGQLNIALLLSDNPSGDGATIFLQGSHRIAKRMKELGVEVPPRLIKLAPFLFSPLSGRTGDVAFFLNRTWHGRFANQTDRSFDVILIGFFPEGGQMGFPPPYVAWSPAFLASIAPSELGRLMDPSRGTVLQDTGVYRITGDTERAEAGRSFSLGLEHLEGTVPGSARLRASIALLRLMMTGYRTVSRLVRAAGGAQGKAT